MAELLICAKDSNGIGAGQYRKGDIVGVYDVGELDGCAKVGLPKFFILKIPEVSVAKVLAYTAPEYVLQDPEQGMIKRRIWGFKLDDVPEGVRNTIITTGSYTTTVAAIKPYVRHKNTDAEADFNG